MYSVYTMYIHCTMICVKIPPEMLERIDLAARDGFMSRSAYIRETLALRLKDQYITKIQKQQHDLDDILLELLPPDHPLKQSV